MLRGIVVISVLIPLMLMLGFLLKIITVSSLTELAWLGSLMTILIMSAILATVRR